MKKPFSLRPRNAREDSVCGSPADESCDFSVVRALRAVGHDVVAVAELWPRAEETIVKPMVPGFRIDLRQE
jgi:hypothetical protein